MHEQQATPPRAWLYRYEARGIQQYILTTERMREMAAASSLVEELADLLQAACPGEAQVLMSAAGTATVLFASGDPARSLEAAGSFAARWPMLVARKVPGLRLVQHWTAVDLDNLSAAIAQLRRGLDAAGNRPAADLPEAGPLLARAGRTGLPAVAFDKADKTFYELHGLADAATRKKIARTDRKRGGDPYVVDDVLKPNDGRPFVEELADLGEGYAAVVHTDGNGVGAFLTRKPLDYKRYCEFSEGLGQVTRGAAKAAVQALADRLPDRRVLPMRPLVLGGDDLTVVIAAEHALAFVDCFTREFEKRSRERLGSIRPEGFTASTGIAFVKIGFPFHQAYHLAEDLCKAAKSALRGEADPTPSAVLFHRVKTATIASWQDIQREELSAHREAKIHDSGALSAGPWRIDRDHPRSLEALKRLTDATQDTPRGALREWLRIARNHRGRATNHWKRMMEVLRATSKQDGADSAYNALEQALTGLGADAGTGWEHAAPRTPVLDALTWQNLQPDSKGRLWEDA